MSGWNTKISLCVMTIAVCVMVPGVTRGDLVLPFQENWNHETVGDNANQLTWWNYEPSYGSAPPTEATIVQVSGPDKALNMNPSSDYSMGIRSHRALFGGPLLSVQTDMQLTTDGNGAGVVGFSRNTAPLYGYVLAVSRDTASSGAWLDLRKFNGDLNDSFTVGPAYVSTINPRLRNTYRLEAAFGAGGIVFSVYVNNIYQTHVNLNVTDPNPHSFQDGLRFVLASNYGQQVYFDDFVAIPEPATLAMLMCGSLAVLLRRRGG